MENSHLQGYEEGQISMGSAAEGGGAVSGTDENTKIKIFISTDGDDAAGTIKYNTICLRKYRYNIIKIRKTR